MYFAGNTSAIVGHRFIPISLKKSMKIPGLNGPQIDVKSVTMNNDTDQTLSAISELSSPSPVEILMVNLCNCICCIKCANDGRATSRFQ